MDQIVGKTTTVAAVVAPVRVANPALASKTRAPSSTTMAHLATHHLRVSTAGLTGLARRAESAGDPASQQTPIQRLAAH